jgi:FtsZ-interacting cell division protein ZipA
MDSISINPIVLIIAIAVVVAIVVALVLYMKKERTQKLRSKFGPEYDRAIDSHGNRSHAESELERRAKRVAAFNIHPLTADECAQYADDWRREQSLFVDDPKAAVRHADNLVQDVMKRRGYPVGDFEQNAADLSVDHPGLVENYRIAHDIALRDQRGRASTEDLRRAMVSYHALFDDLLERQVNVRETASIREEIRR